MFSLLIFKRSQCLIHLYFLSFNIFKRSQCLIHLYFLSFNIFKRSHCLIHLYFLSFNIFKRSHCLIHLYFLSFNIFKRSQCLVHLYFLSFNILWYNAWPVLFIHCTYCIDRFPISYVVVSLFVFSELTREVIVRFLVIGGDQYLIKPWPVFSFTLYKLYW
jgi:hypothetical protein